MSHNKTGKRKIYSEAAKKKWSDPKHRKKMLKILCSPEIVKKRKSTFLSKINRKGKNNPNYKHGLKKHPLYSKWQNMKQRCYNPKCKSYKYYDSRGITICDKWENSSLLAKTSLCLR